MMKAATEAKPQPELIHTPLHEQISVVYYRSLSGKPYVIVNSLRLPAEMPAEATTHLATLIPGQCVIL